MIWPLSAFTSTVQTTQAAIDEDEQVLDETERGQAPKGPPTLSDVLRYYVASGNTPPTARVTPMQQQPRAPVRLWHAWKYALALAAKTTEVTADVVAHSIWGPRKKSWGIEMTIITSFMRGVGQHAALVDIDTIRMCMSLGGLLPLPSDALVTPVTFRVRKRGLRGILQPFDERETGTRTLSGEWVVGKRTWHRLQQAWKASQKDGSRKDGDKTRKTERVVLYIHGGAYYVSSAAAQRMISIPLAKYTDARVFAIDYRLAPESIFPGPLHDVVSCYLRLIEDLHIPPGNIVIAGDSAGGGLSLALLMYLRDNNYPIPSGAILMSPWVDLTMSCESWDSNSPFDVVPIPKSAGDPLHPVALYLGENFAKYLTHPYASPLFGDFKGLPPLLIQVGDAEVLRDEITLLAHKAGLAGVEVNHELYEDAIHIFHAYPFLKASERAFMSMRKFVHNDLHRFRGDISSRLNRTAEQGLEDEIDGDSAFVVRGDGTKVSSNEGAKEQFAEDTAGPTETSEDSDEEFARTHKRYQSWAPSESRRWGLPAFSLSRDDDRTDDEEEEEEETNTAALQSIETSPVTTPRIRHRSDTLPAATGLQRLRSALSSVRLESTPAPPISRPPMGRTKSDFNVTSSSSSYGRPKKISVPQFTTMSKKSSLPPSPSLRRSNQNSYADIRDLVQDWTNSGPANETTMYRPSKSSSSSPVIRPRMLG